MGLNRYFEDDHIEMLVRGAQKALLEAHVLLVVDEAKILPSLPWDEQARLMGMVLDKLEDAAERLFRARATAENRRDRVHREGREADEERSFERAHSVASDNPGLR